MGKLIKGLIKYTFLLAIITAIMFFVGREFRSSTVGMEMAIRNNIMPYILGDTSTATGIDTVLTAAEKLQLEFRTARDSISSKENSLVAFEAKLISYRDSLDIEKTNLESLQTQLTTDEVTNIAELAKLYDGMKPAQASQILLQLPDQTVIEILRKMKPKSASKVLEAIDPIRAADIIQRYKRLSIKNQQ